MSVPSINGILGANLLGNLDFLSNLNGKFGQQQSEQQKDSPHRSSTFPVQSDGEQLPRLDMITQLQQWVNNTSSNNNCKQQVQAVQQQKHNATVMFNNDSSRIHSREKKKFSADVSDFLVVEVLKRKELLVENNTSRDLSFSECKRNAWNDVRALLMTRFPGFDLNIEAIKSHWRYRKRKVTDAYGELVNNGKGNDAETKLAGRLPSVDFEIYRQLKDSNLLERTRAESVTSPSDGMEEDLCSNSISPATANSFATPTTFSPNNNLLLPQHPILLKEHSNSTAKQPNLAFLANNSAGGPQQQANNKTMLLEHFLGILKQQQQNRSIEKDGGGEEAFGRIKMEGATKGDEEKDQNETETAAVGVEEHCLPNDYGHRRSQSASTATSTGGGSTLGEEGTRNEQSRRAEEEEPAADGKAEEEGPATKRAKFDKIGKNDEGKVPKSANAQMEEHRREAYISQKLAFDELRALVADIRSDFLPKIIFFLDNFNLPKSD